MDKTFSSVIYLDRTSTKFSFLFIVLFLTIPNALVILGLVILYGREILNNNSIILPAGIYTILTFMMIIISFFILENNKEKSIRVLDEGLIYNSLVKRFAVPWTNVTRVRVNPLPGPNHSIVVYTSKGQFYFNGMYVNVNEEVPKIKPGFIRPKFYYESGGNFDKNVFKNELYLLLKEKIPEKFY